MRIWQVLALSIVASVLAVCAAPTDAHAIAIWNTGEDIFEAGDLPEELTPPDDSGWKAGYKCEVFGIFWAYVHVWDCKPVAFSGDTYNDNEVAVKAIAAKYSPSDMKMGMWQKHGRWAFLLLIILGIASRFMGGDDDDEDDEPEHEPPAEQPTAGGNPYAG